MRRHQYFEWDQAKARSNQRQHRVNFDQAARVLADEYFELFHIEQFDETHSQREERYVTAGSDPYARDIVLVIVWTSREDVTRIISARPATRVERSQYEAEIQRRRTSP